MARETGTRERTGGKLAAGLGSLSAGLAAAQLVAPRRFARLVGAPDGDDARDVVRAVGVREAVTGLGILVRPRPARWAWARVAGDAVDLALLAAAFGRSGARRRRLALATTALAGVTVADTVCAARLRRSGAPEATRLTAAITIGLTPAEVYAFWRDLENLPTFTAHVDSVQTTGAGRSRWRARTPLGTTLEWDAEIVEDRPNELLSWRSLPGSSVRTAGTVSFRPAPRGRGTEVRVELELEPPGGAVGKALAGLVGNPQLADDLRRLKQVLETGEVVRSEGSPEGTMLLRHLRQRAAQAQAGAGEPVRT